MFLDADCLGEAAAEGSGNSLKKRGIAMDDNSFNFLDPIARVWSNPQLGHGFSLGRNKKKSKEHKAVLLPDEDKNGSTEKSTRNNFRTLPID